MEIGILFSQALIALFMAFCCYGAFLIIRDKERDWKARYGNRWIVGPAEKEKLDKAYAERTENKKATRRVKVRNLSRYSDKRAE